MANELAGDAVKQIRSAVAIIVLTCVIWIVTLDAVRNSLIVDQQARELAAWLVISDLFPPSVAAALPESPPRETITCLTKMIPVQSGTEIEDCVPITAHLPWPGETPQTVHLALIPGSNDASHIAYYIDNVRSQLPLAEYSIAVVDRGTSTRAGWVVWVFPSEDLPHGSLRAVSNAALVSGRAVPRGWAATMTLLRARGWQGNQATDARLNDPVVAGLLSEVFTKTYSIAGIPVSPRLYPVAVSAALLMMAFLLVGPTLVLYRTEADVLSDSWVMLRRAGGWRGVLLQAAQIAAILICTALPLVVSVTQFVIVVPLLRGWNASVLVVSLVCASTASVVLAACGLFLFRLRERTSQQQPNTSK